LSTPTPEQTDTARFRWPLVMVLGLPLALLIGWLILRMEQPENYATPTGLTLCYPVVVALLLLRLLNGIASRLFSIHRALSRVELLCLYVLMGLGGAFVCWENLGILVPSLAFPAALPGRNEPGTDWLTTALTQLPTWALVQKPDAAKTLLQGGEWNALWRAWLLPLFAWGGLLGVLLLMYQAMARLFFEPWVQHERLTLPLTSLPLEMTAPKSPLWSSPLFWTGALLAGSLDIWNGLATFYPSLPLIPVKIQYFRPDMSSPAWAAVGNVPYSFHPLMIGLAFLLPLDVLFSTWFFYAVTRIELFVAGNLGVAKGVGYTFTDTVPGIQVQCAGALLVLGGYWLWSARRTLWEAIRRASDGEPGARRDVGVFTGGAVFLVVFLSALGLPLWAAFLILFYMVLMALFVTRLRAEFGLPMHNLAFLGPDGPLLGLFGGYSLGREGLTALSAFYAVTRSQQGHPMPHLMEGAYLADRSGGNRVRFGWTVAAIGALLALTTPWLFLWTQTANGLEGGNRAYHRLGMEGWNFLKTNLGQTPPPNLTTMTEMGVGGIVTVGLILLRRVWLTSPFNPVGFAISGSWNTMMVAFPLFLAWTAKALILRYGGLQAYRAAIPLALGVVLGEFVVGTFWEIFAICTGLQPYRIWMF
jgi:hypothetical protein